MKKRLGYMMPFLAFGFMFGGAFSAHGQSTLGGGGGGYPSNLSQPDRTIGGFESIGNPVAVGSSHREFNKKLGHLKAKLTEALTLKDEKVITVVKVEVKDALNEHFANELAIRESELAVLIKRADNAASQNKQRLDSKDELIELQLQSYVLEVDAPEASLGGNMRRLPAGAVTAFGGRILNSTSPTTLGGGGSSGLSTRRSSTSSISNLEGGTGQVPQQNDKTTIEEARMKLARAASVDEETQATKELKEALSVYFLRDLEERDRLLKIVRADIEKMQQKLKQRSNSKDAIVGLQFKIFVNEASGLGFFSPK